MNELKRRRDPLFEDHETTPWSVVISALGLAGIVALGVANFLATGHY